MSNTAGTYAVDMVVHECTLTIYPALNFASQYCGMFYFYYSGQAKRWLKHRIRNSLKQSWLLDV